MTDKVYILLEHDYIVCDNCNEEILVYHFSDCLMSDEFDYVCKSAHLTYNHIQRKLYDNSGFERYEVIEKIVK